MADAKVAVAAATAGKEEKMLTLIASDGESFEVSESVAMESQTIKHIIEDGCADNAIPLTNVTSKILALVLEFCKKHVDARAPVAEDSDASSDPKKTSAELKTFDADFVKVEQTTLFELILVRPSLLFPLPFPHFDCCLDGFGRLDHWVTACLLILGLGFRRILPEFGVNVRIGCFMVKFVAYIGAKLSCLE